MRGDSIRDLYAKTLALLGLGVLAGTGALVDYWPSGVRLPAVGSGFSAPELSLALAVPEQALEPDAPAEPSRPTARRRMLAMPAVNLAALVPEATSFEFRQPINGDVIQTVALLRPAVLVPVAFAQEDVPGPLGEELALSEPELSWSESTLAMSTAPVTLDVSDHHGMLAGVMRVTKSSLVTTGRKTGASIIGAFRAVRGVVKKALPN